MILKCFGYAQRTVYDYLSQETNDLRHNEGKWYSENLRNVVAAQRRAMAWGSDREVEGWVRCVCEYAKFHGGELNFGDKFDVWMW